ncbi:MAG: hypothetical protein OXC62_00445 [Aestuariivita sp.]|nr:hypothetical protein [Aestuariivita sp.]
MIQRTGVIKLQAADTGRALQHGLNQDVKETFSMMIHQQGLDHG